MPENENPLAACPFRNRCAFVDESCSQEKSVTCDVLTNTTPKHSKAWDPHEPVAVTLIREQWENITAWLKYCTDWNHCNMVWWRDWCNDKRMGAEKAAQYAAGIEKYETICKIIEEATYAEKENQ